MPSVQAAAPAPLPAVAAPGGVVPEEGVLFDQALSASLTGEQPVFVDGAPAHAFADTPALVEWLLRGVPEQFTLPEPAIDGAIPSEGDTDADDELDLAADANAGTQWDIPVDVVVTAVPPQPQAPPVLANETGQTGTRTDVGISGEPSAAMRTATAQDAPDPHVDAAEPQTNLRVRPEATARHATKPQRADTADRMDPPVAAPHGTASPVGSLTADATAESVDQTSITSGERPAAVSERRAPNSRTADVKATAAPVPDAASQAVTAAAIGTGTAVAEPRNPASDGLARETAAPVARGAMFAAQPVRQEMSGGDAQSFEQESRHSPAAQRLAAALSAGAPPPAEGTGGTPAPVFTVPSVPVSSAAVAPVHTVAPAQPAVTQPDVENINRLIETMRVTAKAGGWEATVRLRPEHLGEVTIALRVDGNTVSAIVQAESAGVRQWLQSQEEAVRSGLLEHGLDLGRYQVDRDGHRRDAEDPQPQEQKRRRGARRHQDGTEQRFEIVV